MKRKGFGTSDLVMYAVGIAIILGGIVYQGLTSSLDMGKRAKAMSDATAIANAVSQYKYEVGNYPVNLATVASKQGITLPTVDAYGNANGGINGTGGASAYCYAYNSTRFAVWSVGANKANNSGGSGTNPPSVFGGDDVGVLSK